MTRSQESKEQLVNLGRAWDRVLSDPENKIILDELEATLRRNAYLECQEHSNVPLGMAHAEGQKAKVVAIFNSIQFAKENG